MHIASTSHMTMMMMMMLQKLLLLAFAFLMAMALASELVPLGVIEVSMASTSTSNPESFPIQVLSQTVQFLGDVFRKEYGSAFQRVSLSIHSRGIHPAEGQGNTGYVAAMKLTGTAYFRDGMTPASLAVEQENGSNDNANSNNNNSTNSTVVEVEIRQIHDVLTTAFEDQNQDFIIALSQSPDHFLSNITYAVVSVNDEKDDIDDTPKTVANQSDNISAESIETWLIAVIAGVSGFLGVLCLCLLCVCCWGDDSDGNNNNHEKEPMNSPHDAIQKTESGHTKTNSDLEELHIGGGDGDDDSVASTIDVAGSKITLDVHSIMSQNSSQFTYNPSSLRSTDAHTLASFTTQEGNIEINLEEWKKAAVVGENEVAVPFGQDISAIEHKKDLSLIVEGESESPTPLKKGCGSAGNNSNYNNNFNNSQNRSQSLPGGAGRYLSSKSIQDLELAERSRRSGSYYTKSRDGTTLDLSRSAQEVIDDLNDLSLQVAAFRNNSRPSM